MPAPLLDRTPAPRGYTLVELLVVIGLIVIIGSLIVFVLAKVWQLVKSLIEGGMSSVH